MGPEFGSLLADAWRVMLLVLVPALAVPVAGALLSLLLGLLGLRDEGVVYALRVLVMIGVGVMCIPACVDDFQALMTAALR
jgi:hypothetical protein